MLEALDREALGVTVHLEFPKCSIFSVQFFGIIILSFLHSENDLSRQKHLAINLFTKHSLARVNSRLTERDSMLYLLL